MQELAKDIQLMLRFQKGEESCFEELVELYKNHVFRVALYFLKDHQESEDASQEVFINVYKNKDKYKISAKFSTWLFTICRNVCFNKLRVKKPAFISLNSTFQEQDKTEISEIIADTKTVSPLQAVIKKETQALIKEAIYSLPQQQKMAVILRRYEDLSYEEIAKIMGVSVKAVKSLLHRAKLALIDKLKSHIS